MRIPMTNQFVEDMESAGFNVTRYAGYAWRFGPGVRADDDEELQNIIRATSVRVGWDTLGLGFMVYPEKDDKAWYEAHPEYDEEEEFDDE
jgi:hypothetical protein